MHLLNRSKVEAQAHDLAQRMPELLVEASRVAHTVTHGVHGRRRKGAGDTFWQFRPFEESDAASQIDWRRSAATQNLFVREREWEAAHTVWLWPDNARAMDFASHLSPIAKIDRSAVLTLALAQLLVRAGERVGIPALLAPSSTRYTPNRVAEVLTKRPKTLGQGLPFQFRLGRFSECVIMSDFLTPLEQIFPELEQIAAQGVRGHLVQILDPAEESLPYQGRIIFEDMSGREQVWAGRAESLAQAYQERLQAHRRALADKATHLGWSFIVHHTDRPAAEALLALFARLNGAAGDYRYGAVGG